MNEKTLDITTLRLVILAIVSISFVSGIILGAGLVENNYDSALSTKARQVKQCESSKAELLSFLSNSDLQCTENVCYYEGETK